LVGGAISFAETINARLPYQSLFLAGMALLLVVAVPMTAAAVGCIRDLCYASSRSNASLKATGSVHDHFSDRRLTWPVPTAGTVVAAGSEHFTRPWLMDCTGPN